MIGGGLRLARQARGYSQQQLAGMAGISRQAISALESGVSDPSLRVALALARALGMTVEELFGPESTTPTLLARAVPPAAGPGLPAGPDLLAGTRVALAPIGESFAALPLTGPTTSRAGFLPAGGLVTGRPADQPAPDQRAPGRAGAGQIAGQVAGQVEVQPIGPPRPTLIVAGCDPALPLLEAPLALLDPPIGFTWWPCTSSEALRLAAAGLVHAAGVHLRGRSGGYNTGPAGESLGAGTEVIGFSAWREGLVIRPDLAGAVGGVADVVAAGLRLVNREPGAEARRVLDRELASLQVAGQDVPGYQTTATGHLQVADAIAAGLADAGVASEPAALAYGLAFVPLTAERFDLVIPARQAASREVQALVRVLSSRWLLDQLASLPGYDPAPCGQHVATLPGTAGG
ncbi:MAG: helix-turn-helix domain-containing protein [Actinomycetota bacterium]|nr:helix-turn-helix domain-containing protein [Actinomycetota bacterium]